MVMGKLLTTAGWLNEEGLTNQPLSQLTSELGNRGAAAEGVSPQDLKIKQGYSKSVAEKSKKKPSNPNMKLPNSTP